MLYLFLRCYQLETINLPNSLVSIGTEAFAWCNSLKDVTFPSGLEAIGDDALVLMHGILSGDVAIYEYDKGVIHDEEHNLAAMRYTYNGQKIGYISKADKPAFVTCLKLKRKVYGEITDINTETFPTQYEFETWFDSNK